MQIALSEMFHESKNIQNRAINLLLFLNCSIDWVNAVRIQRYFQSFDLILISKSVLISILKYNTCTEERKQPPSPLQGKATSRKVRDNHSEWNGQQHNPSSTRKKDFKGTRHFI